MLAPVFGTCFRGCLLSVQALLQLLKGRLAGPELCMVPAAAAIQWVMLLHSDLCMRHANRLLLVC
jgi:hypothetical protein